MSTRTALTRLLDASAVSLSGLCLVHCLALPVAAAFLPLLGAWARAEWIHVVFLAIAIPVSCLALLQSGGWRSPAILVAATAGLAFLSAGVLGWPDQSWETGLTVCGGLLLATAHLLNWRRHGRHD